MEHTEPVKVDKGKSVVKPVNGRIESTSLDNPESTALELENEKLLWAGLTNQPDAGSSSGHHVGVLESVISADSRSRLTSLTLISLRAA